MLMSPPPVEDRFTDTPIFHLGVHLYPVRNHWDRHIEKWNSLANTINGKCIIGICVDDTTNTLEEVKSKLDARFEIFETPNINEGENVTFRILQKLIPSGQNDILLYCHGKGVRAHTFTSEAVRMWTDIMYETVIFNQDKIVEKFNLGYANFHSFRTFGKRALGTTYQWHPSGTFFAVRAKYLPNKTVKKRYGGVEGWCGDHFPANCSWCEFYDNSMFTTLYDTDSMRNTVWPLFEKWKIDNAKESLNCD